MRSPDERQEFAHDSLWERLLTLACGHRGRVVCFEIGKELCLDIDICS